MDRFSKIHPLVQMLFYLFTLGIVLSINDPVFSGVCLLSGFVYNIKIRGRETLKSLKFLIVLLVLASIINMLFAHYGEDVLFKIKGTEFTGEALFYGFNQGMILCSVFLWFDSFSRTVDSEKIVYLFRFSPKLALIFSMVLGFIPRFTKKLSDIHDAQLGLMGGKSPKNIQEKLKQSVSNLSSLVTYSLESSIITADSMQARGYNPRAIKPSKYKYRLSDFVVLLLVLSMSAVVIITKIRGQFSFIFEPKIYYRSFCPVAVICFAVLELLPTILDLREDMLWKISSAKT